MMAVQELLRRPSRLLLEDNKRILLITYLQASRFRDAFFDSLFRH